MNFKRVTTSCGSSRKVSRLWQSPHRLGDFYIVGYKGLAVRRDSTQQWLVFCLLVGIGIVGRWGQPQWNVTPLAAAALFAGYYFTQRRVAVLVPLVALTISNLALEKYDNVFEMAAVYVAMALPVLIGTWMQQLKSWPAWAIAGPAAALASSITFFLLTNFAVWAFTPGYHHTLAKCYADAIPFFRLMAAGDLIYTAILFGCYAFARQLERRGSLATV